MISRLCLSPIILSFSLWAGVTLRHPVPNSKSTYSSEIIGISLFKIGMIAFFPLNLKYLSSSGFTAIAVSPKIVSGLVVATLIYSWESEILYFI